MSLLRHAGRWSAAAVLLLAAVATASAPAAVCAPSSSSRSTETTSSRNVDVEREEARSSATCEGDARTARPGVEEETNSWGPFCEARLCMSDMDCSCGWRGGYCDESSVCQYN